MSRLADLTEAYYRYVKSVKDDWVYHETLMEIIRLDNLQTFSIRAFNEAPVGQKFVQMRAAINAEIEALGDPEIKPWPTLSGFKSMRDEFRIVTGKVWAFGRPRLIGKYDIDGCDHDVINMYNPANIPVPVEQTDADVAPFLNHVRGCFTNVNDAEVLLDWMAWIVQNPTLKVRWAPLIYSPQGIGKDTLVKPLHHIFGKRNTEEVEARNIDSQFNAYDKKKLIVINEMQNDKRYSTYDRIKPKISGTGSDGVYVNEKHEKPVYVVNVSAWMVFTNHGNAMPMEPDDRRFYVIRGEHVVSGDEEKANYFDAIHSWFDNEGGKDKVHGWLCCRDVSAFNPNQPPPETEAKAQMKYEAMPEASRWVSDLCEVGVFRDRDVIIAKELADYAASCGRNDVNQQRITQGMRQVFTNLGSHPIKGGAVYTEKTTWYARRKALARLGHKFCADYRDELISEMPAISRPVYFSDVGGPISKRPALAVVT